MRRGGEQHNYILAFPSMRWAQCIGPMDKRTELAQKAPGRSTYDVDSIRYISISF